VSLWDPDHPVRAARILRRRDPVLGAVIHRVGPPTLSRRTSVYSTLLRSILHQQLAGAAARAIERRVVIHFGGRLPEPAVLLATRAATLRGLGLSRQKIAAMRSVAQAFRAGRVRPQRFAHMSDAEFVEALTRLRGVGEWTAQMTMMFSLGRPDVLPVGDYGVRKGMQQLYGLAELPKPTEMQRIAAPWRPYRTVASWYLWRHLDPVPGGD